MPLIVLAGSSSSGTKTMTIPAPPTNLQNTVIDYVSLQGFSATGAGVGHVRCTIPIATNLTTNGGSLTYVITPTASGVGNSSPTTQVTYPGGGLLVASGASSVAVLVDAIPSTIFSSMDCVVGFHYA